jgi:hypothetical protein
MFTEGRGTTVNPAAGRLRQHAGEKALADTGVAGDQYVQALADPAEITDLCQRRGRLWLIQSPIVPSHRRD